MSYTYQDLEQLLLHKDVHELTVQEQKLVEQFTSLEDYELQRNILLKSQELGTQKPIPPANNLAALQTHFKAQQRASRTNVWAQPIPAYQALLLACLVGCIIWWTQPIQVEIQQEVVYVPKTDTILQEKIVVQEKIVYQTIQLPAPPADTIYVPVVDKKQFYQEKEQIFANESSKSKSMKEMGRLMDFLAGSE